MLTGKVHKMCAKLIRYSIKILTILTFLAIVCGCGDSVKQSQGMSFQWVDDVNELVEQINYYNSILNSLGENVNENELVVRNAKDAIHDSVYKLWEVTGHNLHWDIKPDEVILKISDITRRYTSFSMQSKDIPRILLIHKGYETLYLLKDTDYLYQAKEVILENLYINMEEVLLRDTRPKSYPYYYQYDSNIYQCLIDWYENNKENIQSGVMSRKTAVEKFNCCLKFELQKMYYTVSTFDMIEFR